MVTVSLSPLGQLGACRPHTRSVAVEFVDRFPILQSWAYDPRSAARNPPGEHGQGRALDLMVFVDQQQNIGSGGRALGQRIFDAMWADRVRLGVEYVIWDRHIISTLPDEQPGVLRPYTGDNPHTDHVHTTFLSTPPAYRPALPPPVDPTPPANPSQAGIPMRRDPFNQHTTADQTPQKLTPNTWTRIKMSQSWYSLNRAKITPCLFAYDAAIAIDGLLKGAQIQVRTFTTKSAGAEDDTGTHRTGLSPVREFVATEGRTFIAWSQVAQELNAGEYLRVEVAVTATTATVVAASSKAVFWPGA